MKKIALFILSIFILISCGNKSSFSEYKVYISPKVVHVQKKGNSHLIINVEIPANSHIYGNPKGPGTGMATSVVPDENKNFIFESPKFLPAKKYTAPGEKDFVWVYENQTKILLPFHVKKNVKQGIYKIKINYKSLMCTDNSCIPEDKTLFAKIEVGRQVNKTENSIQTKKINFTKDPQQENLFKINNSNNSKQKLTDSEIFSSLELSKIKPTFITSSKIAGLIQAIIFGLIAGFILNFMPCVLPVVSLKIMSFVKHSGESKKKLRELGLLFALGILVSFTFLALLAAFFGYNWGGLFQNKIFLIAMISIVFALALSMFEVFTIQMPSFAGKASEGMSNEYADAFVKGLLATLLATPCSGPFLGGTLAWALAQPALIIFIIFMSVGLGMALPYIILTLNPRFTKFIPKPGDWMNTFEHAMAFLLIFTVIYLVNILDNSLILPVITFLGFLAIGFWQYGKLGAIFQPRKKRLLSLFVLLIVLFGGYFLSFNYLYKETKVNHFSSVNFTVDNYLKAKKENKIIIIKFTADWCPNCKLVEKMSLYTKKVANEIKKQNIVFMVADITKKFPAAEMLLEKLGSRSIPFLAVFPDGKNKNNPICLRDIYSEDDVLNAIKKAVSKDKKFTVPLLQIGN